MAWGIPQSVRGRHGYARTVGRRLREGRRWGRGEAAKGGTLDVGAALSLTGALAKEGRLTKFGYQLCQDKVNSAGGIKAGDNTFKLAVTYKDDKSQPDTAAQLVDQFNDNGRKLVLGRLTVHGGHLRRGRAQRPSHGGLLRRRQRHLQQGLQEHLRRALAGVVLPGGHRAGARQRGEPQAEDPAIISAYDGFSQTAAKGGAAEAAKQGMKVLTTEFVAEHTTNVSSVLTKIKPLNPDVILVSAHVEDAPAAAAARRGHGRPAPARDRRRPGPDPLAQARGHDHPRGRARDEGDSVRLRQRAGDARGQGAQCTAPRGRSSKTSGSSRPTWASAMPGGCASSVARARAHPVLEVSGLEAGYGRVQVLWGIDLEVGEREVVALVGSNGAGKTTLLRAISGMITPTGGDVQLDGRSLTSLAPEDVVQAGIAHVPEGWRLFAGLTVRENLLVGAYARKGDADIGRAVELFPHLGERLNRVAGSLSGGEQQMCAIARGLMANPKLIMIDELSLGLAPKLVEQILNRLASVTATGTSVLLVEQDVDAALEVAARGYVLENGRIITSGDGASLLADPRVHEAYLGVA